MNKEEMLSNENVLHEEILLKEDKNRYVLYPIMYKDVWKMYKDQISNHWTVEEISLRDDLVHWEKLSNDERHFIECVLAFFSSSDGIVSDNILKNLYEEIKIPEVRAFYSSQAAMESIHNDMYGLLIDTYIKDNNRKREVFNAIDEVKFIQRKCNWAIDYIKPEIKLSERLIAFAIVEGIFFSSSFCAIYWLKKRGLMPGLTFSNELIARDEGLHVKFGCLLYNTYISNKLDETYVKKMVADAIEVELDFVNNILPVKLLGINSDSMCEYVKFVADQLLLMLGYTKMYMAKNPFEWMNMISLEGKTNFFEKKVSEYRKANLHGDIKDIDLNADF